MEPVMDWLAVSWPDVAGVLVSVIGAYAGLMVFTRIGGLRSFSKMSSFDFAVTVAIGSVLAATILAADPPLARYLVALGLLYAAQLGLAWFRARSAIVARMVDNEPLLLMRGPEILHENLRTAKITESDLRSKLRGANVLSLDHVHAVVFETTGDVSVMHGDPATGIDEWLLDGIRTS